MNIEQRILVTARKLFSEKLYVDVSVIDIVLKSGVARSSFYNFFSTKEECFVQAILPMVKEIPDLIFRIKYEQNLDYSDITEKCRDIFVSHSMVLRNCVAFMYSTDNNMFRELLYMAYKNILLSVRDFFMFFIKKIRPHSENAELELKSRIAVNSILGTIDVTILNTLTPMADELSNIAGIEGQMTKWLFT